MTEPKRWTVPGMEPQYMGDDEHGEPRYYNPAPPIEVVAAADFDRLRDERDRLAERNQELAGLHGEALFDCGELERVAGVLADALRNAPCYCDHRMRAGLPPCSRCSALAVFDTLTEENADA